jgi:hypothetical protein
LQQPLTAYLPSSIGVAVGGYIAPSFAVNPLLGYAAAALWRRRDKATADLLKPALGEI